MLFDKQNIFSKDRFRDFVLTLFNVHVEPAVISVVSINDFPDDDQEL